MNIKEIVDKFENMKLLDTDAAVIEVSDFICKRVIAGDLESCLKIKNDLNQKVGCEKLYESSMIHSLGALIIRNKSVKTLNNYKQLFEMGGVSKSTTSYKMTHLYSDAMLTKVRWMWLKDNHTVFFDNDIDDNCLKNSLSESMWFESILRKPGKRKTGFLCVMEEMLNRGMVWMPNINEIDCANRLYVMEGGERILTNIFPKDDVQKIMHTLMTLTRYMHSSESLHSASFDFARFEELFKGMSILLKFDTDRIHNIEENNDQKVSTIDWLREINNGNRKYLEYGINKWQEVFKNDWYRENIITDKLFQLIVGKTLVELENYVLCEGVKVEKMQIKSSL